jgi:hypothetical protein
VSEIVVDAEAGTLQVSRSLLLALGAFSGGATGRADPPSGVTVKALRAAGMLGPTGLHDLLVPIAAAVADPLVRLTFDHLGPGPVAESPGWITPDVTVLAVPGEEGLDEILSFGTSFLIARIAGLVGLGPHPDAAVLPGSLKVDPGLLEAALTGLVRSADDVRRHLGPAVPAVWVDAIVALREGFRRHWRMTTTWGAASSPRGRSVEIIEGLDGTMLLVGRIKGGTELSAVTPTAVWRLLIGLLPGDDEL